MSLHIADDEQAEIARNLHAAGPLRGPRSPRVPAGRGHLLRWRSSTMCTDIACVAPPCTCPRGVRNAAPHNSRTGS